ncbi:MAG: purine-nucleoside phosphorylase [Chitinophagaceae bacterium]
MDHYEELVAAANFLKSHTSQAPQIAVVLGSGLHNFTQEIDVVSEVEYSAIPHFPVSTVEGHHGRLLFGTIGAVPIVAMSGRFHYYEGYSSQQVVFPIRVLKMLGVDTLLLSNAAGGVHPSFKVGDLMIIKDHISFSVINPLLGVNDERLGKRFPDMSEPYSKALIAKMKLLARDHNIELKEGVYYGVTGPTFETRAEYGMIRLLGGDAVGMSTVQEVIAAVHSGMQVFAMSIITDIGIREEENSITHAEVLEAANAAEPKFSALFRALITTI